MKEFQKSQKEVDFTKNGEQNLIKKADFLESNSTFPYYNLALEEYLLDHVAEDQIILYLWQNKHTVVIGKNQNSWKECKIRELEESGGHLVRRLSGGGAVYHDLGNLNFTFLVPTKLYDLEKQMEVILRAVRLLGLQAEKSGRNDILLNGMKFSGNAFLERGSKSYHHGTLMVDVNLADLQKYLNVDLEKLKSNAVDSVRARVTNLSEHFHNLSVSLVKEKLIEAFGEVYGVRPKQYQLPDDAFKWIQEREDFFSSWDFKYGKKINFEYETSNRFSWGNICMQFHVVCGKIEDVRVYSDAMKQELIGKLADMMVGKMFHPNEIIRAVQSYDSLDYMELEMCNDIVGFMETQEF